jgi:MOSC domain-containing protein YiiM
MNGRIDNLFLKVSHKQPMKAVAEATAEANMGLVGDVSYGRKLRQVLLIERETLDEFGLTPGQVRENAIVRGIALAGLPAGTRVQAGDALLEVTDDCAPCQLIEDIRPGLRSAMDGRRGTLFRVLEGGTIRVDDEIWVVESGE